MAATEPRRGVAPAPTTPPHPVRVKPDAEAVFLSPRVVDSAAFDDFAGRLRALIGEAQGVAATLTDASRTGRQASDAIGAMFQQHAERVGALRSLLKALDEHKTTADALMRGLAAGAEEAREAEASLELRLAQVEEHITALVKRAEETGAARADEAERRQQAASKRLGALEVRVSIVESLAERVHELAARVERLMEDRASRLGADDPAGAHEREAIEALEEWQQIRREAGAARSSAAAATLEAAETTGRLDEASAQAADLLGRLGDASDELTRLLRKGDTLARLLQRLTGPKELVPAGAD
jgi:chromosome segregation ATPase